jgi:hypothetical protein
MSTSHRLLRLVAWAVAFYVATVLVDLLVATGQGEPIHWISTLTFWASVAPFWAMAMDWTQSRSQRRYHRFQ